MKHRIGPQTLNEWLFYFYFFPFSDSAVLSGGVHFLSPPLQSSEITGEKK